MRKRIGMVFLAASVLCSSAAISAQAERKSQDARSAAETRRVVPRSSIRSSIAGATRLPVARWAWRRMDNRTCCVRTEPSDLEHAVLNTSSSVFEAGSVSKQFTAAGILLLAQQGKLTLTDDVRKYIPSLPDYGQVITINHLLNHTSGLRDWGAIVGAAGWPRSHAPTR